MIRAPEQIVSDFLSEVADRETLSGHNGELDWLIEDARTAQTAWRTLLSIRDMAQPVPPQEAWQGISTAPKDGTEFDIWCVKREGYTNYPARIANCRHNEGVLEYLHSHGWFALKGAWEGREVIITHWMPRPEPPTDEGEK